jgi:hypothetical protein
MTWQIVTIISMIWVVISNLLMKWVMERFKHQAQTANRPVVSKVVIVFYQYLFIAGIMLLFALTVRGVPINGFVLLVGLVTSFANYFQWQAYDKNLSKSTLFLPLSQVLGIGLAFVFLSGSELIFLNPRLILGIILSFLAIYLMLIKQERVNGSSGWFKYTIGAVVILGTSVFLLKFFAVDGVTNETFLVSWYIGSLLGAIANLLVRKESPFHKLSSGQTFWQAYLPYLKLMPVAIAILAGTGTLYWALTLGGPLSLVLPPEGMAMSVATPLLALWLFKEGKQLSWQQQLAFFIGLIGAVLILFR